MLLKQLYISWIDILIRWLLSLCSLICTSSLGLKQDCLLLFSLEYTLLTLICFHRWSAKRRTFYKERGISVNIWERAKEERTQMFSKKWRPGTFLWMLRVHITLSSFWCFLFYLLCNDINIIPLCLSLIIMPLSLSWKINTVTLI